MLLELNKVNFNKHTKLSIIDFWAPWCGPCKMIAPLIEEIALEYKDKATFAKVNVDENRDLVTKFNIRSVPTILFFKDGKVVNQIIGLCSKETLVNKIEELLK